MLRLKTLKYALPMVAFLAVSAISSTPASAHDWQPVYSNGDGVTLWYDKDSGKSAVTIERNGRFEVYFDKAVIDAVLDKWDGSSNPNPDDPNNGKGTFKPDIVALIKQGHGTWNVPVNPENSPIGSVINGDGGGKIPHWNPGGEEGDGKNHNPGDGKSAIERYNEEQKAKIQHALEVAAREAGKSGMGMFDGSEGGSESWGGLKPHGGIKTGDNKGPDGDQGDSTHDASDFKDPYLPKGEDLGAKPEIVNPTPDGKKQGRTSVKIGNLGTGDAKGKSGNGTTGKGDAQGMTFGKGKGGGAGGGDQGMALGPKKGGGGDQGGKTDKQVSTVMSPGLLDGGNGLAFNGPSGAGHVGGHVSALRGGR